MYANYEGQHEGCMHLGARDIVQMWDDGLEKHNFRVRVRVRIEIMW